FFSGSHSNSRRIYIHVHTSYVHVFQTSKRPRVGGSEGTRENARRSGHRVVLSDHPGSSAPSPELERGSFPMSSAPTLSIAPYLFYEDVDRAAQFLERAFGFSRIFESRDPAGGLAHAQLSHTVGKVMLGRVGPGLRPVMSARSLPALHGGVYVYVDDVD